MNDEAPLPPHPHHTYTPEMQLPPLAPLPTTCAHSGEEEERKIAGARMARQHESAFFFFYFLHWPDPFVTLYFHLLSVHDRFGTLFLCFLTYPVHSPCLPAFLPSISSFLLFFLPSQVLTLTLCLQLSAPTNPT
ncbi:hypothetical protein DFH09DRAFT_1179361 [Mycena vulgaris]|nr:hypothetical protein DFH09DRAFT_1179361 [Mycena vulgaris]